MQRLKAQELCDHKVLNISISVYQADFLPDRELRKEPARQRIVSEQTRVSILRCYLELRNLAITVGNIVRPIRGLLNHREGQYVRDIYTSQSICFPILNGFVKFCEAEQ